MSEKTNLILAYIWAGTVTIAACIMTIAVVCFDGFSF
jgi:hypothetical protein